MTFVICLYIFLLIIYVSFIRPRKTKSEFNKLIYKKMKHLVFWGFIIVVSYGGYFELLVSAFLCLCGPKQSIDITYYYKILAFGICWCLIIVVPASLLYVIRLPKDTLLKPKVQKKWGLSFFMVDVRGKFKVLYCLIFLIRRFLFILICFFESSVGLRLIYTNLLNLFVLIYVTSVRPKTRRLHNRMEIFNEYSIVLVFNICFTFTDFNNDEHMKHMMGWATLSILIFNLSVSIYMLVRDFFRVLGLYLKKYRVFKKTIGRLY